MKKLLYIVIAVFGAALMSSCTGSARIAGGGYYGHGYYDDMYFYGHPGVFRNTVIVDSRPNVIVDNRGGRSNAVAPKQRNNESRAAARRAQVSRQGNNAPAQRVAPARSNVNRSSTPARVQSRSAAPATRSSGAAAPARQSRRGGR